MNTIALAASAALLISSTAAGAATTATPAAVFAQAPAPSPWMMLSVLSPTRSVALGGAAAAAQPADVPPPPPGGGPAFSGELAGILLWFGLIAIALTISGESGAPNSPR